MAFRMDTAAARKAAQQRTVQSPPQAGIVRKLVVPYESADEYVREIEKLWAEASETFLLIGRWLNKAKERLPYGDYLQMVNERLPFSPSRAFQLRAVATMVDGGRVTEEELPRSSSAAYMLSILGVPLLEQAKAEGIVRPDVQRKEVLSWRDRIVGLPPPGSAERMRKRQALQAKLRRAEEEVERVRALLAELDESPESEDGPVIDGIAEPTEADGHQQPQAAD